MLLSIIIVSYNTQKLTLQTVNSVLKTTKNSKLLKNNLEIIVIDNNSKDDTIKSLKSLKLLKNKSKVPLIIIQNKNNLGFGNANNQGIKKASGNYYLFLNSDTIVKNNALESMVQRFLDNKLNINSKPILDQPTSHKKNKLNTKPTTNNSQELGILTPILLNTDLTYQSQGGAFPTLTSLFFHMSMLDDLPFIGKLLPSTQHTGKSNRLNLKMLKNHQELINVDWVGGTAMMISKKAVSTFGPFDQNIFMYGEDMEICIRAKNHNLNVALDPTSEIIHLQNASSSSENAIIGEYKGYLYIFAKHKSIFQTAVAKIILQYGAIARIFVFSFIAPNKEKVLIYKKVLKEIG